MSSCSACAAVYEVPSLGECFTGCYNLYQNIDSNGNALLSCSGTCLTGYACADTMQCTLSCSTCNGLPLTDMVTLMCVSACQLGEYETVESTCVVAEDCPARACPANSACVQDCSACTGYSYSPSSGKTCMACPSGSFTDLDAWGSPLTTCVSTCSNGYACGPLGACVSNCTDSCGALGLQGATQCVSSCSYLINQYQYFDWVSYNPVCVSSCLTGTYKCNASS